VVKGWGGVGGRGGVILADMYVQRDAPLPELFVLELLPRLFQSLLLRLRHIRVAQVEAEYGGGQDVSDDGPGGPLVVGRDDVPGGPPGGRGAQNIFERRRVLVPEAAGGQGPGPKLARLRRVVST